MAYSIVPIDMGAVLESNPNLDVGLLQLYKAYEVAEKDVAFLNTVPVRGKVTVNDSQYDSVARGQARPPRRRRDEQHAARVRRPPLRCRPPGNRSRGPRNTHCCESLWKLFLGPR